VRLADWLALLVFPGGLLVLTAACLWLFVGLVRQRRNREAAVAFITFVALVSAVVVLSLFLVEL
jgi:hypothetical protein